MLPSPKFPVSPVAAWLLLALAALAGAGWWWALGRPVALPDAPSSRIACVSYSPFYGTGATPYDPNYMVTPVQIDADLRVLSQRFDCVRTYSQGNGLSAVPAIAARYHMKVLMGIWLGADERHNAAEIARGIATAKAHPEAIRGVVVGNEVLLRGDLSPTRLTRYIHTVRDAIPASIPVTYADVWEFWLRYPKMASAVDYITIHILPYWENDPVAPADAVRHVADVYARMQQAFPGKPLMIGETGWPSEGRSRRSAVPSVVNEARYLREFLRFAAAVHLPYNVIEAFDQPWKRAQEGTVGGYWGIFDTHGRPKFALSGPVVEESRWWLGWLAGVAGAALFAVAGGWRRAWRGLRGWAALLLAGFAAGTAFAWQCRQMIYACGPWREWLFSSVALACALFGAARLARFGAARMTGCERTPVPPAWLRYGWLYALALYDLLMVFDSRYRDFPFGLFALPCVGYAWLALLARETAMPSRGQRFLACAGVALGAIIVAVELGMSTTAWLWLGLNVAIAVPVFAAWRRHARLQVQQA